MMRLNVTETRWFISLIYLNAEVTEQVAQRCSVKRVFLETSQNLQENASVRVSFLIKLQVSGMQLH